MDAIKQWLPRVGKRWFGIVMATVVVATVGSLIVMAVQQVRTASARVSTI